VDAKERCGADALLHPPTDGDHTIQLVALIAFGLVTFIGILYSEFSED